MEKKDQKNERKRKALLVLPLGIIPFVTLAFWAFGGGSGEAASAGSSSGLNVQLPEAKLKGPEGESKMSFYDQAEKDSGNKPGGSARIQPVFSGTDSAVGHMNGRNSRSYDPYLRDGTYQDPNETKVYQKLADLNRQLVSSANEIEQRKAGAELPAVRRKRFSPSDVEAKDTALGAESDDDKAGDDSDLHRLNGMMDKILDIQHPERVRDRVAQMSGKGQPMNRVLRKAAKPVSVSTLGQDTGRQPVSTGFFSLGDHALDRMENNAVEAVVHGAQTLVEGGTIKLRLLQDVYINEQLIPKDKFVFGAVSLNGERLEAAISSIRVSSSLFGVNLRLYDLDGREGISIPGALTREVVKSSADNAAQLLEVTSLDPSLKAQATSAGLSAVKALLSKKAKLIRVSVKSGYKVLLKNVSNS